MVTSTSLPPNVRNFLATTAEDARAEAMRAIPTCLKLAGPGASAGGRPGLGDPFPIIRIGLNKLKSSGKDAGLVDFVAERSSLDLASGAVSEVLYPVLVSEEMAGSVTLERQEDGGWKSTVFNNLGVARALIDARQERQATRRSDNEQYTGISVRALGFYFLGVLLDNGDLFIPLASDLQAGFEKGVPVLAKDALAILSRLANDYNGQPG